MLLSSRMYAVPTEVALPQVLFPYAAERLAAHLEATYESEQTAADIQLLRTLVCTRAHHNTSRCAPRHITAAV